MSQVKDKIHILIRQEFVWHYVGQQKVMDSKPDMWHNLSQIQKVMQRVNEFVHWVD
jgi:hypothetical protein